MVNVNIFAISLIVAVSFCTLWVEASDKDVIVKRHNEIRELVRQGKVPGQPKGVNIVDMEWDHRLATQAQKLAEKCIFRHENVTETRWRVGQNLYYQGGKSKVKHIDWVRATNSWYAEYKDYKYTTERQKAMIGHYTQVVWHNSKYVGCGYHHCAKFRRYQNNYVCNYGPAGNRRGELPYQKA